MCLTGLCFLCLPTPRLCRTTGGFRQVLPRCRCAPRMHFSMGTRERVRVRRSLIFPALGKATIPRIHFYFFFAKHVLSLRLRWAQPMSSSPPQLIFRAVWCVIYSRRGFIFWPPFVSRFHLSSKGSHPGASRRARYPRPGEEGVSVRVALRRRGFHDGDYGRGEKEPLVYILP